ncbi:hypothetical protein A7982_13534 [Minicystis rosea]|nr:hypothetical protein A7982_13534 [Minicystis rosea]
MGGYPTCAVRRWDFFIGYSVHEGQLPVIPPVPPIPMPHLSFGIVSGTQLFAQPTAAKHETVLCDGVHLMGRLSDAFPVVPHLTYPMIWQPMLPLTILFGSSTSCWGSGKVVLQTSNPIFGNAEADIATYLGFVLGPHIGCNEPFSAPLDIAFATNTTCQVGFGWGDLAACLIDIAIQLAMEVVMKGAGDAVGTAFRKFKAWKKGSGKLAKLREANAAFRKADTVAKEASKEAADHAAAKVGKEAAEDSAAKRVAELDDAVDAGKKSNAVDISDELDDLDDVVVKNADEVDDVDAAQAALNKKASEAKTAAEKADLALQEARQQADKAIKLKSSYKTQLKESGERLAALEEQASKIDELYKDAPERLKIERQQAAAAIAAEKKTSYKLSKNLADLNDDSWSAIWKSQHKGAAKKAEEVAERSKYLTYTDYMKLYGAGSVDNKILKYSLVYPAYKFVMSGGFEFLETMAFHSGSNMAYLIAHRASASLKKIWSRVGREVFGSYASENKGVGNVSARWTGYSRLDLIEDIDGDTDAFSDASSTSRFGWVSDGATSKITSGDKLTWTSAAEVAASQDHWADTSYVTKVTDRFGWVDDLESDESA